MKEFFNTKTEEWVDVVHPNTIAVIESETEMSEMDLIRVKLPEGKSESDMDREANTL